VTNKSAGDEVYGRSGNECWVYPLPLILPTGNVLVFSRNDSFEAVVLPHLDAAHNLARWLMRDAEAAEDVLQDAIVRALTYFPTFKGINPRGWLLQIVRNAAYGSMKVNRGVQMVPIAISEEDASGTVNDIPSDDDDPEASLIKARDDCYVRQLIAALPIELREPLVLRELEELSYKEIAEVTRTPIGTVMSRLWRARSMVTQMAGQKGWKG
jgi:RNA polymerase sigma factor (sigma-70 family)